MKTFTVYQLQGPNYRDARFDLGFGKARGVDQKKGYLQKYTLRYLLFEKLFKTKICNKKTIAGFLTLNHVTD